MGEARDKIIERIREEIIIRPTELEDYLDYSDQTIQNWLRKLMDDEEILKKFDPSNVQNTYYFLKEKRKEAEEELVAKGFDEIDIIKGTPEFKDVEDKIEVKFESIKEIEKKATNSDRNWVLPISQAFQELKETIESESDLEGYLAVFENEDLMEHLKEKVEDTNNLLEVDYHTYYHLDLFLSLWEEIARHSEDKTEGVIGNNSDKIWFVITLCSKILTPREPGKIEHKMIERRESGSASDIKNSDILYEIRDKAGQIIDSLFEGYFQEQSLEEGWMDDLIRWYLRDESEEIYWKVIDTKVDGMHSLVEGEKCRWEKILIDHISDEDDREYIKSKIEEKLNDDRLSDEESTVLSYIIKTAPYSPL